MPSVWRAQLTREDWDFYKCPDGELEECFGWEFRREAIQRINGGRFPENPNKTEYDSLELLAMEMRNEPHPANWFSDPDFPRIAYVTSRTKRKWAPLERMQIANHSVNYMSWRAVGKHYEEDVIRAMKCSENIVSDDGCELAAFQINWPINDEVLVDSFRQWLKENRPQGQDERPKIDSGPRIKAPTGASSAIRQWKKNLKYLSAIRLLDNCGGNRHRAYSIGEHVLGRNFAGAGAWSEAKSKVFKLLKNEFGFTDFA